ncbi:TRM11 family SAM-dependent methyltransferase [Ferrimonas balearica]|uniref:TRM11 family SAM-dependent methyltransferase n=1 Tax=Ferrimonas balearica TaxID=44012 RepID=UPI001C9A1E39|nr:hypothetical protein [Ferrimonas balearica]MBY5992704.1 hypothetical protein [Ferrimonas balearica]
MFHYAILAHPGHNRIYFQTALAVANHEIEAIMAGQGITLRRFTELTLGLPACISFETDQAIEGEALKALAAASLFYALFQIHEDGRLSPVAAPQWQHFPESLSQILKYTGKTNEQFTRLMVNLAHSACRTGSERLRLVDPMCGKGTTLYEGLIHGFDVEGIEINTKWVQEIQAYMVKFLKTGKYKHKLVKAKRNDAKGKKVADQLVIETAADKADYAAGRVQQFKLCGADTRQAQWLLKRNSCDLLVSDLPYGVQHGSKNAKDTKLDRSALTLLEEALPGWHQGLKSGGALALSFNEFTMKWKEVAELLAHQGFEVLDTPPYTGFLHRVDQSINRNLILAVKA